MIREIQFTVPLLLIACVGCNVSVTGFSSGIQGSGLRVTESRVVPEFDKVRLKNSANVVIDAGGAQQVEVTTDDNLLDIITTEVEDGTLVISSIGSYSTRIGTQVKISVPSLSAVSLNGSGDISVNGLVADEFDVDLMGSGDIVSDGQLQQLSVGVVGSGDVTISGNAATADISSSGSGDVDLSKLQCGTVKAGLTGSGDITVCASDKITASVVGSGDIRYSGHSGREPIVNQQVTGSGDISRY